MEINADIKNEWIQADHRRKIRAERRRQFIGHVFGSVRRTFLFLLVATVLVFALNHYNEIENIASAKLGTAIKKIGNLHQNALNEENEVDEITK